MKEVYVILWQDNKGEVGDLLNLSLAFSSKQDALLKLWEVAENQTMIKNGFKHPLFGDDLEKETQHIACNYYIRKLKVA